MCWRRANDVTSTCGHPSSQMNSSSFRELVWVQAAIEKSKNVGVLESFWIEIWDVGMKYYS